MKKLTVCIILSLLMCLSMAFPASAAKYDASIASQIEYLYSIALSKRDPSLPANYKYMAYCAYFNVTYPYLSIIYFTSPTLVKGSQFRIAYVYEDGSYNLNGTTYSLNGIAFKYHVDGGNYVELNCTAVGYGTTSYRSFNQYYENLSNLTINVASSDLSDYYYTTVPPPIDTTALQALITTAKAKQSTGYSASTWQALQNSITAAESLLSTTGYTQAQVDAAKDTLQAALDNLRLLPDALELQALINQAQAIQKDTHTPETWQSLQDAISSAQAILSTSDYTQSEIESALSNLQAAISGLDYLPDTTDLEALVEEADQIEDIGYTEPSWNRFDTARTSAHVLLARTSYTATEVQTTGTELRASMNALTLAVIPVPPDYGSGVPYNIKGYNIGTGDVSGFFKPFVTIFLDYVNSSKYVILGIFSITFSIKLIPYVFNRIKKGLRR